MQICSKVFTAAAVALLLPPCWAPAQQSPQPPATANSQTSVAPQLGTPVVQRKPPVTAEPASGSLPQAPSAMLAQGQTGLLHQPGSGAQYVAGATLVGPGGFAVEAPTNGPLSLSLEDAIALGLKRNQRVRYEKANQRLVLGYTGDIVNAVIPNLKFRAASSTQEINLIGLGFKPSLVAPLLTSFGLTNGSFPTIIKVSTTSVQVSLDQALFNLPDFELFRAIKPEKASIAATVDDTDEQLVQAIATAYLQVLADQSNLGNSIAQESAARALFDQTTQLEQAGVGVKLDVLRAQVTYQQREQQHVSAEAQLDKDGIQLNRIMGIPAGQQLDLTDSAPFAELADMNLDEARQTAYSHRSDLHALDSSIEVSAREAKAVKYQRYPTLGFSGFYGILGLDSGPYHGVFTAEGSLRFPIFREAAQRGEQHTADAQLDTAREQQNSLRGTIDMQVRDALLDVSSSDQLVKVAQSNVQLAQQELSDSHDRFTAGVTDNLEVVDAQASVTSAEAQLVSALFQYNVAKVNLARSTGVLQSQYRSFLGM